MANCFFALIYIVRLHTKILHIIQTNEEKHCFVDIIRQKGVKKMGRLIDTSVFDEMTIQGKSEEFVNGAKYILDLIDAQPTAYDVEKVVAELEEALKLTREAQTIECRRNDGYGTPLQSKFSGEIKSLVYAVSVVKRGGVE